MNVAIFEDDRTFAGRLETIIRQHTHFPTIVNTAEEAELYSRTSAAAGPVLYFLDIMLDGEPRGLALSKRIAEREQDSLIVFLTAYPLNILTNPYFKALSFSFILKCNPSLEDEVRETITLADKALHGVCLLVHIDRFQTLYIPYDDICYIERIKHTKKLCIHCLDGQYIVGGTLKGMLETLGGHGFVRCHKSYIVNQANIRVRNTSDRLLLFANGTSCPYSYLMKGERET